MHLNILRELRKKIIDDVDVRNNILCPLERQYVLRKEDVEKINSGQTREARAKILLDILSGCSRPHAFDVFHQALVKHYPWLSSDIDNILRSSPTVKNIEPGCNLPQQKELVNRL